MRAAPTGRNWNRLLAVNSRNLLCWTNSATLEPPHIAEAMQCRKVDHGVGVYPAQARCAGAARAVPGDRAGVWEDVIKHLTVDYSPECADSIRYTANTATIPQL